jgi:hypothetical protein
MSEPPASPQPEAKPPKRPRFSQRLRLPEVSGKWTVIWLLVCFTLTAALIPILLRRAKPWIEMEIVVAVWWILWALILTKLLYKGERISDDHQRREPRDWLHLKKLGDGVGDPGCSTTDGEGCLVILGLIAALFLVWVLIEVAIPVVFFLLYFVVRGMLANVVNDKTRCQGNLGQSAIRGLFWATLYSAPIALTIWLVHWIHMKRNG